MTSILLSTLLISSAFDLGVSLSKKPLLVEQILANSQLSEGDTIAEHKMLLALISVESSFRPSAKSGKGAVGLMQLTRLAVIDAAIECGLDPRISGKKLLEPAANVRYGTCYLRKLRRELTSWVEVLAVYNGGYRQLKNLRRGKKLHSETAQFIIKVLYRSEVQDGR